MRHPGTLTTPTRIPTCDGDAPMTYPQQPGGWSDPASGAPYVDPATGQPAYPTSPGAYPQSAYPQSPYPQSPGYSQGQAGYVPAQPAYGGAYPGYAQPVMVPAQ